MLGFRCGAYAGEGFEFRGVGEVFMALMAWLLVCLRLGLAILSQIGLLVTQKLCFRSFASH